MGAQVTAVTVAVTLVPYAENAHSYAPIRPRPVWEQWKSPAGQLVETCSIITTTPNSLLQDVHDRMPVILPDDVYDLWLDPGFQKDGHGMRPVEAVRPVVDAAIRSEQPHQSGEE
jgi:putative SOS response-associated peptidase YedK